MKTVLVLVPLLLAASCNSGTTVKPTTPTMDGTKNTMDGTKNRYTPDAGYTANWSIIGTSDKPPVFAAKPVHKVNKESGGGSGYVIWSGPCSIEHPCGIDASPASQGIVRLNFTTPDSGTLQSPPAPEWVPDPSAGHYDCPTGWTAYSRSEPYPLESGPIAAPAFTTPAVYVIPLTDKKGHVLGSQPAPPICIQEAKP